MLFSSTLTLLPFFSSSTSHTDDDVLGRVIYWCFLQKFLKMYSPLWKLEIYVYRNQKKSFVKIRASFATPFSRAKNLGGPLGAKKNCLQIWVYYIQNDRLGHTVSMKLTINWSEFVGLRYPTKRAWISLPKPNRQISARFAWYLSPINSD